VLSAEDQDLMFAADACPLDLAAELLIRL